MPVYSSPVNGTKSPGTLGRQPQGSTNRIGSRKTFTAVNTPNSYVDRAIMKCVRKVRLFSLADYVRRRVYFIYTVFCIGYAVHWNVQQHRRMRKLYPDYDELLESDVNKGFVSAKAQELTDIYKYNAQAKQMRQEVS